jgi:hypothetical protein
MGGKVVLVLGASLAVACGPDTGGERVQLGDLELAPTELDFGTVLWGEQATLDVVVSNTGDLPLGIAQIAFTESDYESSFSLDYDFAQTHCANRAPAARGQVLDGGCSVPVHVTLKPASLGPLAAGVAVVTTDDPSEQPAYFRDPDELSAVAIVRGNARDERPRIHVEPTGLDFGFVWLGQTAYRHVTITNVGSAALTLGGVELPPELADQLQVVEPDSATGPVAPGGSTLLEMAYSPQTIEQVRDQPDTWMRILSNDPDVPAAEIRLLADQAGTEEDERPQVTLIGPPPGTVVGGTTLQLELDIHDANQPATSLSCRVMSARLLKTALADCQAPDDTGHFFADVPTKLLQPGVDTISVEVWDAFGQKSIASTTILYYVEAPENDADGDGYADVLAGGADCDDHDDTVYPQAAEIADGRDNGCEAICNDAVCGSVTSSSCVDEDTTLGDDDADCFVEDPLAANGGDCNDNDATTFPDAFELADFRDNDCDGLIDEALSQDDLDGDGFSPWAGDCDDGDATVGPAAVEYCEGRDQNCDGVIDDACLPAETSPVIVGGLRPERTDIGVGETTAIDVTGFDPDGDPIDYAWTQDKMLTELALVGTGGHATFTAPARLPGAEDSATYELIVQLSGESGPGDWAFGYLTVHADPVETTQRSSSAEACRKAADQAIVPFLPLAVFLWTRRRRRPGETSCETSR